MEDEFIIVNKTLIQKRIEELDSLIKENNNGSMQNSFNQTKYRAIKRELKEILSESTPLIPEIIKAFKSGSARENDGFGNPYTINDYISSFELDI